MAGELEDGNSVMNKSANLDRLRSLVRGYIDKVGKAHVCTLFIHRVGSFSYCGDW